MSYKENDIINHSTVIYQENIDYKEIANFSKISTSWWNPKGKLKLLHRINPLRLDYILERANGLFEKNVLDVGCGGGILSESMAREGAKVTGIDIDSKLLAIAHLHAIEQNMVLDYYCETVEMHAENHPGAYDVITCMEVLEHVPFPSSIIHACANLVKPNGEVFFSTLNRNFRSWLTAIIGAEYILHILPKGIHNINKFIKPAELLNWIDNTLLYEQHIIGLHYNPIKDCFYLDKNIDINYMLHTRRQK